MDALLPEFVAPTFAVILIAASLITSAISAAFGLGGGILLLAIMGLGMPLAALIPVHGVVQLGSNAGRAFVQRHHVTPWVFLWFAAGSLLGAAVGSQLVVALPESIWRLSLGAFLILITWMPRPRIASAGRAVVFANGILGTVLNLFFGATGPFALAINAPHSPTRQSVVATHAASMTLQHFLKIAVFGFLGFAFGPWVPLILAMVLAGYIGTLIGSRMLERFPESAFRSSLRWIITALALLIMLQGVLAITRSS